MEARLTVQGRISNGGGVPNGFRALLLLLLLGSLPSSAVPASAGSPDECLSALAGADPVTPGLYLGRAVHEGRTLEPVLLWRDEAGQELRVRDCYDGRAAFRPLDELDQEPFNSALVARFYSETADGLPLFRGVAGMGFVEDGQTKIELPAPGTMLEARRLTDGSHVELTGTNLVQILPEAEVPILLVASRDTMEGMDLAAWDETWGEQPEDSQVERRIHWWELLGSNTYSAHPTVSSFGEVSGQVAGAPGTAPRDGFGDLRGDLEVLLAQDVIAILVADRAGQVSLAEAILDQIVQSGSDAGLDVARLEEVEKKEWSDADLLRLEEASVRGRLLRLVRYYDLAAIMPDRIAGKVRRNYRQSIDLQSSVSGLTAKTYAVLASESDHYRVANAMFQDQAAGMAGTIELLACLLDAEIEPTERRQYLEEGLERLSLPVDDLTRMTLDEAFRFLFQGFSLPAGSKAGERSFLASLARGDAEVSPIVHSLRSYFDANRFDRNETCDLALIPDAALEGGPFGETLILRQETRVAEVAPPPALLDDRARAWQAKNQARLALRDAIYTKGAKHTKRKIEKGHRQLDKGNEALARASGNSGQPILDAIEAFEKAEKIFLEAKETAFKLEHEKPKLRVH